MGDIANLQSAENTLLTSTNKISDSTSLKAAEKALTNVKVSDSTSLNAAEKKLLENVNSKMSIDPNKTIKSFKGISSKLKSTRNLYELGRPCTFHDTIDPNKKISQYLKSKMNIVDLIPCGYNIELTESGTYSSVDSATSAVKNINSIADLIPTISYDEAIAQFQRTCVEYNLVPYKGIRIYTTDDTTNTENIQTSYEQNFFQDLANKGSSTFSKIKLFGSSLSTNANSNVANSVNKMASKGADMLQDLTGMPEQYTNMLKQTAKVLSDVIIAGKKISFPNVWQDTTYTQTMNCSVKLISPYGHPTAIKEFIIRPLMYILLLVSPYTNDGITYGKPPALTIKSYGTGGTRLGGISSINIVKGGAATTFNVYKQPLVVDIQINFSFLVDGFAVHKKINTEDIIPSNHSNLINIADKVKGDEVTYAPGKSTILNGIIEVVESLLPININNYAKKESEYQGTLGGNNGGTSGTTSLGNSIEGGFSGGGLGGVLSGNIDLANINSGTGMDSLSNMMSSMASGLAGGLSVANDIISGTANIMNYANNVSNYGQSISNSIKNLTPTQAIMNSINTVVSNSNNIVLQNSFKDLNKELYNTNKSIGIMCGNVNSFLNVCPTQNSSFNSVRNTLNDLTSMNADFNRSRSISGNIESNINGILSESIDINNTLNNITNNNMNMNNRLTLISQVETRNNRLNSEISEFNNEYETDFEEPPLTSEELVWYKSMAHTNNDPEMIAKLNTLNSDTSFQEQFGTEFV